MSRSRNKNENNTFLYNELSSEPNRNRSQNRNKNKNRNEASEWNTFKNTSTGAMNAVQGAWGGAPLPIKFGYILVFGTLLYYFTVIKYNFYGVITITIFLSLVFWMISIYLAIAFIIMMISVVFLNYKYRLAVEGYVVPTTEIKKSGEVYIAYDGKKNHQYVEGRSLPGELTIGSYAYSFWLYVNKPVPGEPIYRADQWKSIFYRGTAQTDVAAEPSTQVQYPGVWIKPDNTTLAISFKQQGTSSAESVEIPSIEYGQWNHYVILCNPHTISVYKNKLLEVTSTITQMPTSMSNYGIFVTSDKPDAQREDIGRRGTSVLDDDELYEGTGFDGKLAYVTFHQTPLTPSDIENVYAYHKDMIDTYVAYENKLIPTEGVPPLLDAVAEAST